MPGRDFFTALLLFGLALAYFSLTATRTLDLKDEGYLLLRSVEVAAGAVPHRDFSDVYGPGVFAVTAAALKLGGGEILAVRVLVMGLKALAVVLGFAVARMVAPLPAAFASAVLAIAYWGRLASNLNTPYAAIFTLPLASLALWLLILALRSPSRWRFFGAGLAAGSLVLFKQSLGAMLAFGMLLSIVAVAMCRAQGNAQRLSRPARFVTAFGWFVAGLLPVLPALRYLVVRDYALHFLPFHALIALVAVVALRRGGSPRLGATLLGELAPFGFGALVAPVLMFALYASWGSTNALVHDMFRLPLSIENYYTAAVLPPASLMVSLAGFLFLSTGVLRALAARFRSAAGFALLGAFVMALGRFAIPTDFPRLYSTEILVWRAPFALEGVLLPGLLFLGAAFAVRRARSDEPPLALAAPFPLAAPLPLAALLPLAFMQALLCFEVFPRAGHNAWILHGALAPLFAWVLYAWFDSAAPRVEGAAPLLRRAAALLVVLLVPAWLVGPIVRTVLSPAEGASERRAPTLPHARGLSLGFRQIASEHIDDLEHLIAFLERAEPRDAPLFVLATEHGVALFSGRRDLFEDHTYAFFLAGWGMLPFDQRELLDSSRLLDVLRQAPDVLVVHRSDATAKNLRRALPRIREYVEDNFEVVARFGVYRVLRRSDRATLPLEPVRSG